MLVKILFSRSWFKLICSEALPYVLEQELIGVQVGLFVLTCLTHLSKDLPGFVMLVQPEEFLDLVVEVGLLRCRFAKGQGSAAIAVR